jgi:voltage-gated potassium channel Kch
MSSTGRLARQRTARTFAAGDATNLRAPRGGTRPIQPPPAPTTRQRMRYRFDATMAAGPIALVGWLALVTLALIGLGAIVALIFGLVPDDGRQSFVGQLFSTLMHAMDPGTVAGDTGGWPFLVLMLVVTLGGLFIVSALVGVIATALDEKLLELRKGRSFVVERDHTLVLGWSDAVFTILPELAIANESEKNPSIVILADRDKVEMEDAIRAKVPDLKGTRVICRTGSPIDLADVAIANPHAARSVIVLSPESDDPDAEVIKTVLALTRGPHKRADGYQIVAEIHDPANLEAAELVGGEQAVFIDKRETIAKLIVQASRQSGVSAAYVELLDFDGEEIYFRDDPVLVGVSYGDALLAYEQAAVIGLHRASGEIVVNPPMELLLEEGDRVIAIAEDDSVLERAERFAGSVDATAIVRGERRPEAPQRVLVIGWNARTCTVVNELDHYVAPGSHVTVMADAPGVEAALELGCASLANLAVETRSGNTTDRATLEAMDVGSYDHVIVMCYAEHLEPQRADARTLVTLLHLRDIAAKLDGTVSIVSEMLDDRNHELAQVTEVDDVIVSDKVLSLLLAQISENPHLAQVFRTLFDADGSELYLREMSDYVEVGAETSFATVIAAARERGETAVGLRLAELANDPSSGYGMRLNPAKSAPYVPAAGDQVVVLAED